MANNGKDKQDGSRASPTAAAARLTRRGLAGAALGAALARRAAATERQPTLTFDTLYKSFAMGRIEMSDRVRQLVGQTVGLGGYMAPPLKPESRFFVLTSEPLAICPFCSADAEWPADIVVVYLNHIKPLVPAGAHITVTGRLDAGSWIDPDTGFVSQLRLMESDYKRG